MQACWERLQKLQAREWEWELARWLDTQHWPVDSLTRFDYTLFHLANQHTSPTTFTLLDVPRNVLKRLVQAESKYWDIQAEAIDFQETFGAPSSVMYTLGIAVHRALSVASEGWMPSDAQNSENAWWATLRRVGPYAELAHLCAAGVNLQEQECTRGGLPMSYYLFYSSGLLQSAVVLDIMKRFELHFGNACDVPNHCVLHHFSGERCRRRSPFLLHDNVSKTVDSAAETLLSVMVSQHRHAHDAPKHCKTALLNYVREYTDSATDIEVPRALMEKLRYDPLWMAPTPKTGEQQRTPIAELILRIHKANGEERGLRDMTCKYVLLGEMLRHANNNTCQCVARTAPARVKEGDGLELCAWCGSAGCRAISLVELMARTRFIKGDNPLQEPLMRQVLRANTVEQLNETWPVECYEHDITYTTPQHQPLPNALTAMNLLVPLVHTPPTPQSFTKGTHLTARALLEYGVELTKPVYTMAYGRRGSPKHEMKEVFALFNRWCRGEMRVRRSWHGMMKWLWVGHLKDKDSPFYHIPRELMCLLVRRLETSGSEYAESWIKQEKKH